jgi:hypothetical protein
VKIGAAQVQVHHHGSFSNRGQKNPEVGHEQAFSNPTLGTADGNYLSGRLAAG